MLVGKLSLRAGSLRLSPLCAVAIELVAQLEARGAELSLDWIPRDANREADALADGEGFDPALRVSTDLRDVRWLVLNDLLDAGARFFREAAASSGSAKPSGGGGRFAGRKRKKLKERDP